MSCENKYFRLTCLGLLDILSHKCFQVLIYWIANILASFQLNGKKSYTQLYRNSISKWAKYFLCNFCCDERKNKTKIRLFLISLIYGLEVKLLDIKDISSMLDGNIYIMNRINRYLRTSSFPLNNKNFILLEIL